MTWVEQSLDAGSKGRDEQHADELPPMNEETHYLSITQVSALLRARKISPVEVLDRCLARIERLNQRLNGFVTVLSDQARVDATAAEAEIVARQMARATARRSDWDQGFLRHRQYQDDSRLRGIQESYPHPAAT